MAKKFKKMMAAFLALVMCMSMICTTTFAKETTEPVLNVTVDGADIASWTITEDGVTAVYIAANGKVPAVIWTSEEVGEATMAVVTEELGADADAKIVSGFASHKIEYQHNKNKTKTVTYTFEAIEIAQETEEDSAVEEEQVPEQTPVESVAPENTPEASVEPTTERTPAFTKSHLLGDAEGTPEIFNFNVDMSDILGADEEGYAVVGRSEMSEFWTAYLYNSGATTEEAPVATIDGRNLYNRGNGANINGIYLDGKFHEGKVAAWYASVQQSILANNKGEKVVVYCADHVTPTTTEARYNVVNIEDATHYDAATAGKIRAVAENGYWGGVEKIDENGSIAKMKAMMEASGKFTPEEIALLSPGVALSATQFAIWELANNDDERQVVNVQYMQKNRVAGYNGKTWNTLKLTPEAEVPCVDLIFKLSHYLTQLSGNSVSEKTTANTVLNYGNILQNVEIEVVEKAAGHANNSDSNKDNDAFVTNVTFDMLQTSAKDNLVAKIVDEDNNVYAIGRIAGAKQAGEVALKNNGDGTYTFSNVTLIENAETTYTVVVEGVQYLERNVYLYSAGKREVSQTLIGYDEGEFSVDVESSMKQTFNVPGIVINKIDEKGNALSGAKFALYAVTEAGEQLIGQYISDKNGKVSIDVLAAGSYKLVETAAPSGYIGVEDPMYFDIVEAADGKGFEIEIQGFEVEFDASYEISNHVFFPAIPQTFVLLNDETPDNWSYSEEYTFGESEYDVMYCGDSTTGLVDGARYVKKTLEDCFDETTAGKLRAIVANSYPYVSMDEMKAAAAAAGVADAANLTRGDIIAAVQLVIWNQTNGDGYTYRDATYSVPDYASKWGGAYNDYSDELPDYLKALTGTTTRIKDTEGIARVDALYQYLLNLEPLSAADCDVNVAFYVAVGGKDLSQSLIGGDWSSFYAEGMELYVKNAPDNSEPPTVSFKSGEVSNISFMLIDANGNIEFLYKIDAGSETSFEIPTEPGKISAVFMKQGNAQGLFWASQELSEDIWQDVIDCVDNNNPSYKGYSAIASGMGEHSYIFKNGKTITYKFEGSVADISIEEVEPEVTELAEPTEPTESVEPEATLDVTVKGGEVASWLVTEDGVTVVYIAANGKVPAVIWTSEKVSDMDAIIEALDADADAKVVFGFGSHNIEYQHNKNKTKTVTYTFK